MILNHILNHSQPFSIILNHSQSFSTILNHILTIRINSSLTMLNLVCWDVHNPTAPWVLGAASPCVAMGGIEKSLGEVLGDLQPYHFLRESVYHGVACWR